MSFQIFSFFAAERDIKGIENIRGEGCVSLRNNDLETEITSRRRGRSIGKTTRNYRYFGIASLAFVLLCFSLLTLETSQAQEEPASEGVNQDATTSAAEEPAASWIPRIPFHAKLSADGGYDDNVGTGSGRQDSLFTREHIVLSYDLPEGQTQLHLLAGAGFIYFFDAANTRRNDVNTNLTLSLKHQTSVRLDFAVALTAAYQTEPDFSSDIGPENRRANFFHTIDSFSVTYHWFLRFSTVTSYTFRLIEYDTSEIGILQNRVEHAFGEQFRFNLSLRTLLVAEYRLGIIAYDTAPRDSITHFALAGIDHNFTEQLLLHLRAGETFRFYDNNGDRSDPFFESSLTYDNTAQSSLSWTMRYGVEEPNSGRALVRTTFRTGLQIRYGLTARISSTAAVHYHHDENQGSSSSVASSGFSQDALDLSVGLGYKINEHFGCQVGYNYSGITSDYSRNRYSAGVNFTY
jgi:hypothetical protein